MSDYIDRAKIIEAFCRCSIYGWSTEEDKIAHEWAIGIIEQLPSAQPDIIRCKDCDNYGTRWCMGYESFYGLKDDDYCSHAERRTDE